MLKAGAAVVLAGLALMNGMMQGQNVQFSAQWSIGGNDGSIAMTSGAAGTVGNALNIQG